ncbi:MAG: hypothetical protein QOF18_2295 [Frankiaceae bacterium]|nr:hypothetical protein [Frankiaceae bacterium]
MPGIIGGVDKRDAEAVLEQLLEVLDERYEAGPTTYVVNRATVEPAGDSWAVRLVFRRTSDGPLLGWHQQELVSIADATSAVTAEQVGWDLYRVVLEAGAGEPTGVPDAAGVDWLVPATVKR